jgi:hypothetical protein
MIAGLVESGRIVDLILALVAAQFAALWFYRRTTGKGPAPADLAPNILAGVALLLALRAALTQAGWVWISGFLAAGLAAHLVDLARRWPR